MVVSILIGLAAVFLGWMTARRLLSEGDPLLAGALSPLLGASFTILAANWVPHEHRAALIFLFAVLGLLCLVKKAASLESESLSKGLKIGLLGAVMAVGLYTHFSQIRFLDTDNWIHEPLIASYTKGIFPPRHPFFPEVQMNGHYGRDLLMATLTAEGQDPLGTVWTVNLVLQLAGFLALFSSLRLMTGSGGQAMAGSLMAYFGMCVGFRVGLVDSFDGNNGVVYALLILLFHLMLRTLRGEAGVAFWLVAGVVLGGYQLVYETHFGLLMLTGLTIAAIHLRDRKAWAGVLVVAVLALGLACTEGGPFTDLARRGRGSDASESQQNVAQHVTVKFPKEHLFQVMVTTADYQRVSAAYRFGLFEGFKPVIRGEGYMSVFDPHFLPTHWLPVLLAPLSLWVLIRRKHLVGQTYWVFGAWAYVVPGLVDFGPLYELEYFRWEFAAGFGFAVALGLAAAGWLEGQERLFQREENEEGWTFKIGRRAPLWLAGLLFLLASMAAGEKLLNDAVIDVQKGRVPWTLDAGRWRVHQPDLGVTRADIEAMDWLAPQVIPGERVLSNLGEESPLGLWPDSVLAARTGALPAGRARAPAGARLHAHPNFYRSALAKAFFATGRSDLMEAGDVQWLFLDIDRLPRKAWHQLQSRLQFLQESPVFEDDKGNRRQVFKVMAEPEDLLSEPPFSSYVLLEAPETEMRASTRYPVRITINNSGDRPRRLGWLQAQVLSPDGADLGHQPLRIIGGKRPYPPGVGDILEHSLVTPLEEGEYSLQISLPETKQGEPVVLAELPFRVDFRTRLSQIQARLDLPDSFIARRFCRLRLGLTSAQGVNAPEELEFYWRLRRPGGEYVWELDSIPQPVELVLEPGVEREYFIDLLTPWEAGTYQPELYLKEKATGQIIPLQGQMPPIHVHP